MSPDPPPRNRSRPAALVLTVLAVLLWVLLWVQQLVVAPQLKRLYDEFGLQLPALTRQTLGISSWCAQFWWLVFPAVLAPAVGAVWLVLAHRDRPRLTRAALVLALLAVCGFTALNVVVAASLALPYVKLQEGLSK